MTLHSIILVVAFAFFVVAALVSFVQPLASPPRPWWALFIALGLALWVLTQIIR